MLSKWALAVWRSLVRAERPAGLPEVSVPSARIRSSLPRQVDTKKMLYLLSPQEKFDIMVRHRLTDDALRLNSEDSEIMVEYFAVND